MNKNLKRIISMVAIVMMCSTSAFAGTKYKKQTITVPRLGGAQSSNKETKSVTGKYGNLMNPSVGGGYTVSANMICGGSPGGSISVKTQRGTLDLPSKKTHKSGQSSHVLFQNKLGTLVQVNVTSQIRTN